MVKKGDKITTEIKLSVLRNGEEQDVLLKDLLDRPTIVSVYMKNNTSSCDLQNISLASRSGEFDEKGYNLIAISKDSCRSHKNYAEKHNISYILASDPEHEFAKATGSIVEKRMYGKTFAGPTRSAYVIDTDGTILAVIEKIDAKNHADELLELVDSI